LVRARRLLALALLVLRDLLVDADLLAHDALDVDPLRLVVVLDQRILYSLLQALRVHREVLVWDERANQVFLLLLVCF